MLRYKGSLMKKNAALLVLLSTMIILSAPTIPIVSSQLSTNIEVKNISWYVDSIGYFIVVGEVQNVGNSILTNCSLVGSVYTEDGVLQTDSYPAQVFVQYLLPQQKAPFYMEFLPTNSETGDYWLDLSVDHVDIIVVHADETDNYQYPDLRIRESSRYVDSDGAYWAVGTLENVGTQTARNIRVVGTYYNSAGKVVAVGYSETLNPPALGPSGTAPFQVGAFDRSQIGAPEDVKIAEYSLLIQVEEPILSGNPPDTSDNNQDGSDSSSDGLGSLSWLIYVSIAVVVIIIIVVGAVLLLRRRKSQSTNMAFSAEMLKKQQGKRKKR